MEICTPPLKEAFEDLAQMRIRIFREYPYLYEGHMQYEMDYLSRYLDSPDFELIALQRDGKYWGFCTGIPLRDEDPSLKSPIPTHGAEGFYIGEILLDPQARGQGWAKSMLSQMIQKARENGFKQIYLYTVLEPADNRPKDYRSPDLLWQSLGFKALERFCAFEWKRWDQEISRSHTMRLWELQLD